MANPIINNNSSAGIGFFGLLTIIFITLKLTNYIAWSWLWVLAPLWMPLAMVVAILALVCFVLIIKEVWFKK